MSKDCYVCQTSMPEIVARDIADWLDQHEPFLERVVRHHSLIHCQGPPEQFLQDGRVVVCDDCVQEGLEGTNYVGYVGMTLRVIVPIHAKELLVNDQENRKTLDENTLQEVRDAIDDSDIPGALCILARDKISKMAEHFKIAEHPHGIEFVEAEVDEVMLEK